MASNLGRLIRRPLARLCFLRSCGHFNNFCHQTRPGGSCQRFVRELLELFPKDSPYQVWSRSLSSDSGNLFDAVVPFVGESITDGTLLMEH